MFTLPDQNKPPLTMLVIKTNHFQTKTKRIAKIGMFFPTYTERKFAHCPTLGSALIDFFPQTFLTLNLQNTFRKPQHYQAMNFKPKNYEIILRIIRDPLLITALAKPIHNFYKKFNFSLKNGCNSHFLILKTLPTRLPKA